MKTENDTITSVISNLRIDSTLVNEYLFFAHFFSFFFIHMLYLLHSLVKYIYMSIYSCVLVYQELVSEAKLLEIALMNFIILSWFHRNAEKI